MPSSVWNVSRATSKVHEFSLTFIDILSDIGGFDDPVNQRCGNSDLAGDPFATANYCKNNFNDYIHAFVTLFELTVVNQWHIITRGYVAVTNEGAFVYFLSFHMIQVRV